MHEMSLVTSLLSIIREETERHALHRLLQVRARYGALANIVPEALSVAFEALTEGAVLQAEEIPLSLKCSRCGQIFSPARQKRFSAPCPFCGEEQGHSIGAGRELYIQSMEAG
jgi:hydrogenase nickel incorporation protein HypA/HybF